MKRNLWKIYSLAVYIVVIMFTLSTCLDTALYGIAYLVDFFVLLSYSFALYAFLYRKITIRLLYWKVLIWINVFYYSLYFIYEIAPKAPIIKYLSILSETGEPDSWNSVSLEVLFVLPMFYVLFMLSKGETFAIQKIAFHDSFNKFILSNLLKVKNFFLNTMRFIYKMKRFFQKLSKMKKILLGIVFVILLILGSIFGYSYYLSSQAQKQMPYLEQVLNEFLIYESNKEYKKAYTLFSADYKQDEDVDTFINKSEYIRPETAGYLSRSLFLDDFRISFYLGQPILLRYHGHMLYGNGEEALVDATFVLKNNKWELYYVGIKAPQSRFDKFIPPQEKRP